MSKPSKQDWAIKFLGQHGHTVGETVTVPLENYAGKLPHVYIDDRLCTFDQALEIAAQHEDWPESLDEYEKFMTESLS